MENEIEEPSEEPWVPEHLLSSWRESVERGEITQDELDALRVRYAERMSISVGEGSFAELIQMGVEPYLEKYGWYPMLD